MSELLIYIRGRYKKDPGPGNWLEDTGEYDKQVAKIMAKDLTLAQKEKALARLDHKVSVMLHYKDILTVHDDGWWAWINQRNPNNRYKDSHGVVQVNFDLPAWLHKANIPEKKTDKFVVLLNKARFSIVFPVPNIGQLVSVDIANLEIHDKKTLLTHRGGDWLHLLPQ